MSQEPSIALAMIVKPSDAEADHLKDCLNSVRPHVDGAFISITGKNEKVREVCEFFDCQTQEIEWNDHFAEARNKSFEFVPDEYDYILWLDADDILENGSELKNVVTEHPADAYSMWYLYSLDENDDPNAVHKKTQIVKNDGSFRWEGRLHEGVYTDRQVTHYLIEDIRRVHMSDEERFDEARERNLRVAKKQVEDHPEDPRSYWNLANSQKSMMKLDEALESFDTFVEKSESEEEKYLAYVRQGQIMDAQDNDEAEDMYRKAIGLKPEFPDAYIGLGKYFYHEGRFDEAKNMLKIGLQKEPPYSELLVYNPREYDYEPMRYLALTCVELNMMRGAYKMFKQCAKLKPNDENLQELIDHYEEKARQEEEIYEWLDELSEIEDDEKLKQELKKLPDEFRAHPMVCRLRNNRFIKKESSGKDIVYFCGDSGEEWTPQTAKEEGIGGSEEAVINLSKQWAEDGYNVTVYNNCGHEVQEYGDVTYKPYWMINNKDKQDVVILWRMPAFAVTEFNADKVFLDMHDALPDTEFTEDRLENIDKVFVKSEFHRSLYPSVPDEKIVVAPNGINPEKFDPEAEKEDKLLINTSSPDRSISALIEGFKKVREEVPDAKLKWAYGWNVFDNSNPSQKKREWKQRMQEKIKDTEGFEALGRISHEEVAELYNEAEIFAYPTEFAEIDCISITKAMAAGAVPVTSDFSALGEKTEYGGVFLESDKTKDTWNKQGQIDYALNPDQIDEWAEAVIEQLQEPDDIDSESVKEDYSWENISETWKNHF